MQRQSIDYIIITRLTNHFSNEGDFTETISIGQHNSNYVRQLLFFGQSVCDENLCIVASIPNPAVMHNYRPPAFQ